MPRLRVPRLRREGEAHPDREDLVALLDPARLLDSTVVAASFAPATRELVIALEGGAALRYKNVAAIGATLGARLAAAEWVQDALPRTILSDYEGPAAKAEAARGLTWVLGGPGDFERAAVRDALSFTGGRWFRVFVGAAAGEAEAAPPRQHGGA